MASALLSEDYEELPDEPDHAARASSTCAGFPSPAEDHLDRSIDLHKCLVQHPSATFFVRMRGASVAGVSDGDTLIVDRSLEPREGRVVVAVVNGKFTVKQMGGAPWETERPSEIWGVVTYAIHPL